MHKIHKLVNSILLILELIKKCYTIVEYLFSGWYYFYIKCQKCVFALQFIHTIIGAREKSKKKKRKW